MELEFTVKGLEAYRSGLTRRERRMYPDLDGIMENSARRLQAGVIARAPRKTGEYIRTIQVEARRSGFFRGTITWVVKSDHPAARRLEGGYVGVDALGRHYTDPPRPHWGPEVELERQRLNEDVVNYFRAWSDV